MTCKKARDKTELIAFTVKKVPRSTVHAFGAACHYHGKKIRDVIAEFMREYAEKVLGKGSKG